MPDAPGRSVTVSAEAGKSAFDIAVDHGFEGTEQEWLNSLNGQTGPIGTGLVNRGTWASGTTYNPNDYVFYGGAVYLSKNPLPFISTTAPSSDTTNWSPWIADLSGYVLKTTAINTQYSITGGGDLSASRTLNLVGDMSLPGNGKYYGTDTGGTKGWYTLPSGGSGSSDFLGLSDTPDSYLGQAGKMVVVNPAANGLEFTTAVGGSATNAFGTITIAGQNPVVAETGPDTLTLIAGSNVTLTTNDISDTITISATGGGGGSTDFLGLTDTPNSYAGQSLKLVRVTAGESGLEFATTAAGSVTSITATAPVIVTPSPITATGVISVDGDLVSLAGATGTNTIYYRSATDTWSPVSVSTGLNFASGVLTATGGGTGTVTTTGSPAAGRLTQFSAPTSITNVDNTSGVANFIKVNSDDSFTLEDAATFRASIGAGTGGSTNAFGIIAVSGQTNIVASSAPDMLTLVAGTNITLTNNATLKTVTIDSSGGGAGGDIASGTKALGYIDQAMITAPANPAAGYVRIYSETGKEGIITGRSSSGIVSHTVVSVPVVVDEYIKGIGDDGTVTKTKPDFNQLTGKTTNAQVADTLSTKTFDNTNTYLAKDSLFTVQSAGDTSKQVRFDLSSVATASLKTVSIPNANTVTVQPNTGAANKYVTGVDSTGTVTIAQPVFADMQSGSKATNAQLPPILDDTHSYVTKDGNFTIENSADTTKTVRFNLGNVPTASNKIITVPNADSVTVQPITATTSKWINAISASGIATQLQPDFTDMPSGSKVTNTQLPVALDDTHTYTTKDNAFTVENSTDTTKQFRFSLANIATGQLKTVNIPNANSTTVQPINATASKWITAIDAQGLATQVQPDFTDMPAGSKATDAQMPIIFGDTHTYFAKDTSFTIENAADTSKRVTFNLSSIATASSKVITVPNADTVTVQPNTGNPNKYLTGISAAGVVTNAQPVFADMTAGSKATNTQLPDTLSSKTFDNSNTYNALDSLFRVQAAGDATKQLRFDVTSVGTGTTKTITVPNANTVTVQPTTVTGSQWITGIDSSGVQTKSQPAFTDVTGPISNKTIDGTNTYTVRTGTFTIQDSTDTTKQATFVLSSIATGTSKIITVPNADSVTVQPILASSNKWINAIGSTGIATQVQPAFTDVSGTAINSQIPATLSSKTFDNTNTYNALDSLFRVQSAGDATKQLRFDLASVPTATTRKVTIPNADTVTVQPTTVTASQWITGIDSSGVQTKSQPAFTDVTGNITGKTLDNSNTYIVRTDRFTVQDAGDTTKQATFVLSNVATGTSKTVTIPNANTVTVQPTTATASQWITGIDSSGVQTKSQPAFTDVTGSISNKTIDGSNTYTVRTGGFTIQDSTDITKQATFVLSNVATGTTKTVTIPNANTVTVQPYTAPASQFISAISASGVATSYQPAFTDMASGSKASNSQLPDTISGKTIDNTNTMPPGTGNILATPTPTTDQLAIWTDGTHIKGVAPLIGGTSGQVLTKTSPADYTWSWQVPPGGTIPGAPVVYLQTLPQAPTGTNLASGVMCGLGTATWGSSAITPIGSGKIWVSVTGWAKSNQADKLIQMELYFGTGTAPSNGAAIPGTATRVGSQLVRQGAYGVDMSVPFTLCAIIPGLTPTTAIWIDVAQYGSGTAVTNLSSVCTSAFELPSGTMDNTAFGPSWDGVVDSTPTKNAVYDFLATLSGGTTNQVLSKSSATNYAWAWTSPTAGGNVSNVATPTSGQLALWTGATTIQGLTALPAANFPALTGDISTTAGSLTTAIGSNKVTLGMLATLAADSIIGNTSASTATPVALTSLPWAYTGDVTRPADSNATTIAANAVTYGKMQAASGVSKLLGSSTASTAIQEIVLGSNLSMSGTTLNATGGGGSGTSMSNAIAQTTHGFAVGDVVRYTGTAYAKALADNGANAEVVGLVTAVADANNFTLTTGGQVTGLSGLTSGSVYFLSTATAGLLTTTAPSTTNQISKPLLVATSTTAGYFFNWRGWTIGGSGSVVDSVLGASWDAETTTAPSRNSVYDWAAKFNGGTANQVLSKVDGTNYNFQWVAQTGGGGSPGGSDRQLQYNNAGAFGGAANVTLDTNGNLLLNGTGTAPYYSQIRIEGSAGDSAVFLRGGHGTPNDWFFGAGSGAPNNYFRIVDLTNMKDVFNIQTGTGHAIGIFGEIGWSSTDASGTLDTGITRNAAGTVEINNGTAGSYRDLKLRTLSITGATTVNISAPATLTGAFLKDDGTWATVTGGSGTPGGSDTYVQFNDGSAFGGDAGLTYNKTTDTLTMGQGVISFSNADYTNTAGAGSHLLLTNPIGATGQVVVSSYINGAVRGKWRTDASGNLSWVAYGNTGDLGHHFYTGGDYSVGITRAAIFGGNTSFQLASNMQFGWNSGNGNPTLTASNIDTALSRNATGTVEINNGTPGQYRDLLARGISVGSTPATPTSGWVDATSGYKVGGTQIGLTNLIGISAGVLVGRGTGSAGAPENITVGTGLTLTGTTLTATSSGTAAGSDKQVQFNDGGTAFGGDAGLTFDKATDTLTIGSAGALEFSTDTGIARNAAGVIEINSGTIGTLRDLKLREVTLDKATGPTSDSSSGFRGLPQNAQAVSYTFALSDAGKHILHNTVSTGHQYTIPANSVVAFPIGTAITIVNTNGSAAILLAINTDTLRRGDGTAGTGSRTIAADSVVTVLKTAATEWYITGKFT